MVGEDFKEDLHLYLRGARETLMWKLEGLSEYDIRRPLTPTGTNLLGLVKHNAVTHVGYFGVPFGRTHDLVLPWGWEDGEPNSDMWAMPDEARDYISGWYRLSWEFADATISELPLEAVGRVPWWGDGAVTLHRVLVHVTAETQRHAGHADIIRESIDGSAGSSKATTDSVSAAGPKGSSFMKRSKRQHVWPAAQATTLSHRHAPTYSRHQCILQRRFLAAKRSRRSTRARLSSSERLTGR